MPQLGSSTWALTYSGRQRMQELDVSADEVLAVVNAPQVVTDSPGKPGCFRYEGNGLSVAVNRSRRLVITLMRKDLDMTTDPCHAVDDGPAVTSDVPRVRRMSPHAIERAREMGLTIVQLRRLLNTPDFVRKGATAYDNSASTYVNLTDDIAAPVAPDGTVLTVLWYREQRDRRFERPA